MQITTVLVLTRKHYGAPVGLSSEATRNLLGPLPLPVAKLTKDEKFVRGMLTKPIRLPLVKVRVRVKAFTSIIIPKIPTPS